MPVKRQTSTVTKQIFSSLPVIALVLFYLIGLNACGGRKSADTAAGSWQLILKDKKETYPLRLSVMNVYVVDPVAAAEYPEAFEIFGENLHLVGTFPLQTRVGYNSQFEKLIDVPITIKMQLMNASDYKISDRFSTVTLPGADRKHVKGQIIFRSFTGTTTGRDGDITLTGEITLEVGTGSDSKTLTGTISVHPVAWG